ncbi:MAG: isochorismatase family cysteine hydrolase [Clostridia bacterium]|nr:isochorismatase family cysteine hydrolase [Clostridia bacterium]
MKALLVIDVQREYMEKYPPDLLPKVNARIAQALEHNELIIYIKNVRRLRSGTTAYAFAEQLMVCSPHIFLKERASIFSNAALLALLRQSDVSEVEIIGVDGNCCVASSAIDAKKLGYAVTLPCQCIGIQNRERFEKKKTTLSKQGIAVWE